MARPQQAARLPPSTQHLLACVLWSLRQREPALALLRTAQRRAPGDFWLNWRLAVCLMKVKPARAVPYFAAALALRPRSAGVRSKFAVALASVGRVDEALATAREAIALQKERGQEAGWFHHNL